MVLHPNCLLSFSQQGPLLLWCFILMVCCASINIGPTMRMHYCASSHVFQINRGYSYSTLWCFIIIAYCPSVNRGYYYSTLLRFFSCLSNQQGLLLLHTMVLHPNCLFSLKLTEAVIKHGVLSQGLQLIYTLLLVAIVLVHAFSSRYMPHAHAMAHSIT